MSNGNRWNVGGNQYYFLIGYLSVSLHLCFFLSHDAPRIGGGGGGGGGKKKKKKIIIIIIIILIKIIIIVKPLFFTSCSSIGHTSTVLISFLTLSTSLPSLSSPLHSTRPDYNFFFIFILRVQTSSLAKITGLKEMSNVYIIYKK